MNIQPLLNIFVTFERSLHNNMCTSDNKNLTNSDIKDEKRSSVMYRIILTLLEINN